MGINNANYYENKLRLIVQNIILNISDVAKCPGKNLNDFTYSVGFSISDVSRIRRKEYLFGVVVVLEDAVVPRKKVYDKVFELRGQKVGDITKSEKDYIHSHVKIISLSQIEHMVLQNMSFLPCLLEQEKDPEQWDNLIFEMPNNEHGLLPMYEQFISLIKKRSNRIFEIIAGYL